MISCQNQFCDTGEKLVVLRPGVSYYCRSCGYVATHAKAELIAQSEKFKAVVEPLKPIKMPDVIPHDGPRPARASKSVDVPRGTKKSKKKGGKK